MASKADLQRKWIDAFRAHAEQMDQLTKLSLALAAEAPPQGPDTEALVRYAYRAMTKLAMSTHELMQMVFALAQDADLMPHDDDPPGPPDLRLV